MKLSRRKVPSEDHHLDRAYKKFAVSTPLHKLYTYDFGLEETVMNQYNVKRGMRFFGKEKEESVVVKELTQLRDMKDIEPTLSLTCTHNQASIMYLKEKKGGSIKGRGCIEG